jgi:hypothetical protein
MKRLAITREGTPELRKVILVSSTLRKDRRKDEERLYRSLEKEIIIGKGSKASKSQKFKGSIFKIKQAYQRTTS